MSLEREHKDASKIYTTGGLVYQHLLFGIVLHLGYYLEAYLDGD